MFSSLVYVEKTEKFRNAEEKRRRERKEEKRREGRKEGGKQRTYTPETSIVVVGSVDSPYEAWCTYGGNKTPSKDFRHKKRKERRRIKHKKKKETRTDKKKKG